MLIQGTDCTWLKEFSMRIADFDGPFPAVNGCMPDGFSVRDRQSITRVLPVLVEGSLCYPGTCILDVRRSGQS